MMTEISEDEGVEAEIMTSKINKGESRVHFSCYSEISCHLPSNYASIYSFTMLSPFYVQCSLALGF